MTSDDELINTVTPPVSITTTEGHLLSVKNTVFLLHQSFNQRPTIVGGFQQWKVKGRTVKKGEKALKIFAPVVKSKKSTATTEDEANAELHFRLVNVFDISQTIELENNP